MNKKEFKNKIEHWKKGDYVLVYSFNYDRATKTNGEIIKYIENQDKEIERLNNIIKEVRELCDYESTNVESLISDILEILDKTN